METTQVEKKLIALQHAPLQAAFVVGLLGLALSLGYWLGHVIETRWAFMQ